MQPKTKVHGWQCAKAKLGFSKYTSNSVSFGPNLPKRIIALFKNIL